MPTKGVIWFNISLSLYYSPTKRLTRAYLHSCSEQHRLHVQSQLHAFSSFASHPLLLPLILVDMKLQLLDQMTDEQWRHMLAVETISGLTGAPRIGTNPHPGNYLTEDQINVVTRDVLGIIQIAMAMETHCIALLLIIESVQKSVEHVNKTTAQAIRQNVEKVSSLILERLTSLDHKTRILLSRVQYVERRTQLQVTAVSRYPSEPTFT